jgi:hypothetical protein
MKPAPPKDRSKKGSDWDCSLPTSERLIRGGCRDDTDTAPQRTRSIPETMVQILTNPIRNKKDHNFE